MKFIPFTDFIRRYYSGEDFIVFDTETTGLNTFHDDIIEVGARRWNKNGPQDSFEELIWVNPNKITQAAWEIHKIPLDEIEKNKTFQHYEQVIVIDTQLNFKDQKINGEIFILTKDGSIEWLKNRLKSILETLI